MPTQQLRLQNSRRVIVVAAYAVAALAWWFIARQFGSAGARNPDTPFVAGSGKWPDIVLYSLMAMPWIGLACAIAESRGLLKKYRRPLLIGLFAYLALLVWFWATVGLPVA